MKKYLINIIPVSLIIAAISSCDREPVPPPEPVFEKISIADLRSLYSGTDTKVDTNVYIQGVITLTPELKNIPDFIAYIQDETAGISMTVSGTNTFAMNSEVRIKCRGAKLSLYRGLMQFGDIDIDKMVEVVTLNAGVPEPVKVQISDILDGKYEAMYVKIEPVEFNATGTFSGSRTLTDCDYPVSVYTRSEALFSSQPLPEGNGTFKGVVSVFDSPQLLIREPSELSMTDNKKCNIPKYEWLNENFETLNNNDPVTNLAGWKSITQAGSKHWQVRYYSTDTKFANITAYNTGMPEVISWMILPAVDLADSSDPVLTFRSKGAYNNGAIIEALLSTEYDGGSQPWNFTWTVLPASYPPVPSSGYGNWGNSGNISLSAYKTRIYVAFRYTGADPAGTTSDKTTTWQVDDIRIGEK